jgi:cysteine synthase A
LVLQEAVDKNNYDQLISVAGPEGVEWATKLAQKEGIMTGISGGASFAVAMKVAENAAPGSVILCMMPDTAERYMTTPLFDAIDEDMNAEELALSHSTPGFQIE